MKPLSLSIQGIGPHSDTRIDFAAMRSPMAIVAPFGTGKTSLLEAIPFALYSCGGWYESIYEMLTQGGTGEGRIEFFFEHGGELYEAVRSIKVTPGGTRSQKATLNFLMTDMGSDLEAAGRDPIAGPKVSDFDREIVSLLGDYETFMATCFLSQNRRGDLIGQPGEPELVARRRAVFNGLIQAGALDAIEERCGLEQRRRQGSADELLGQLQGEADPGELIEMSRVELDVARNDARAANLALIEHEEDLEDARTALRDAQGDDAQLKAQIERHEQAQAAAESARVRVAELEHDCKVLQERAAGFDQARWDAGSLADLRENKASLDGMFKKYEVFNSWRQTQAGSQINIEFLKSQIRNLQSVPGCDDATVALAGRVDALRADGIAAKAENQAREFRNKSLDNLRRDANYRLAGHCAALKSLETQNATKPVTPFGDECSPCPLMREWVAIPGKIESFKTNISSIESELSSIEPDKPLIDLSELRADYERAVAARNAVEAAQVAAASLATARAELITEEKKLADHEAARPPEVADPSRAIRESQAAIDRLAGAQERVKACEQAAADLQLKQNQLLDLSVQLNKANESRDALAPAAESARAALADRETQRASLTAQASKCENDLRGQRVVLDDLRASITRHETRIEALESRRAELAAKRERLARLQDEIDGLRDLRQCFGTRGVRQILIDNAAPELEAIAADLFERATDGRMRLRVATQKVLGDGSIAEDFKILVCDERGERDALRYSGGQLQLIIILFRLSVALWVGRLRGRRPDCLILDEAFDRLGAEGAEALLRVLEHISEEISLIVVVTHDPMIADQLRSQVRLERKFSGVEVNVA